jgi:hypothetical protein
MAAGAGSTSPVPDWTGAAVAVVVALGLAGLTFWHSARRRR